MHTFLSFACLRHLIRSRAQIVSHRLNDFFSENTMALILDGNPEICATVCVWYDLGYLICLRHLVRSIAGTNRIFFPEKTYFPLCICTCSELPSNTSTVAQNFLTFPRRKTLWFNEFLDSKAQRLNIWVGISCI